MHNTKSLLAVALVTLTSFSFAMGQSSPTPPPSSNDNTTNRSSSGAGGGSGIEGTITMGPTHGGAIRVDETSSKPVEGVTFVVQKEGGSSPAATFTTDAEGKFHVSVPPGKYTVVREGGKRIGRFGPFEVEVKAGQMISVKWDCDTGMR